MLLRRDAERRRPGLAVLRARPRPTAVGKRDRVARVRRGWTPEARPARPAAGVRWRSARVAGAGPPVVIGPAVGGPAVRVAPRASSYAVARARLFGVAMVAILGLRRATSCKVLQAGGDAGIREPGRRTAFRAAPRGCCSGRSASTSSRCCFGGGGRAAARLRAGDSSTSGPSGSACCAPRPRLGALVSAAAAHAAAAPLARRADADRRGSRSSA